MIETIAQWSIIPAYLVFGALLARLNAERIYAWRYRRNTEYWAEVHEHAHEDSEFEAKWVQFGLALFWPLTLPVLLGVAMLRFMFAPVTNRQEKAAKLRADAKYWAEVAREEIDPEKQAMAEALAESLTEQAEGMDP